MRSLQLRTNLFYTNLFPNWNEKFSPSPDWCGSLLQTMAIFCGRGGATKRSYATNVQKKLLANEL